MDININVTGLDSIAASINNLANAIGAQNLATGIEAAAAVAKVQSDSKKSTKKSQPAADTATDQASSIASQASDSASATQDQNPDPKSGAESADGATTTSTASTEQADALSSAQNETASSSETSSETAPMSLDELRSVVAEASKRDITKTQALVKEFGVAKISEVPEDKRAELAKLMAGV
jgi:hypothetical protein